MPIEYERFVFPGYDAGIVRPTSIGRDAINKINEFARSVRKSYNVEYHSRLGHAAVRRGSDKIHSDVSVGNSPLGIGSIETASLSRPVAVYEEAGNASFYYDDGSSWQTCSGFPVKNSTARFAQLGGRLYVTTGAYMHSSTDGITFTSDQDEGNLKNRKITHLAVFTAQMLAIDSGANPDRMYISSVVDLNATPILTWDPSTDYIDINPDDGGRITGFSNAGQKKLIFKDNGLYIYDVAERAVTPNNLFTVGAYSQEAITECRGRTYFLSPGRELYSTNGSYPEDIGRPVQDILDTIPNLDKVTFATDQRIIYMYLGEISIDEITIPAAVLLYSVRDESFALYSYPDASETYTDMILHKSAYYGLMGATTDNVYNLETNSATDAGGEPINYLLDSQEQDFDTPEDWKTVKEFHVLTANGLGGTVELYADTGQTRPGYSVIQINNRVEQQRHVNIKGNYISYRWQGIKQNISPVLEQVITHIAPISAPYDSQT
jgi:hypothetical protein